MSGLAKLPMRSIDFWCLEIKLKSFKFFQVSIQSNRVGAYTVSDETLCYSVWLLFLIVITDMLI